MAEYVNDEVDADEADEQSEESPKGLRQAASKSKRLEAELASARRELAFAKAQIDINDSRMKYFVKGYDGEMTAEAIRQAAVEAGFLQDSSASSQNVEAADAQQRVVAASAGAIMEDASEEAALARLEAAMEEGGVDAMLEVARQYGIPTNIEQ